jgi:hypothetical protein
MKNKKDFEIAVTEALDNSEEQSEENDKSNQKINSEKLRYENADAIYE